MTKPKFQIKLRCQMSNVKFEIGHWDFICHLSFGFGIYQPCILV